MVVKIDEIFDVLRLKHIQLILYKLYHMENNSYSILTIQSSKLFSLFDQKGIGIISKKTLLHYLTSTNDHYLVIDPLIN